MSDSSVFYIPIMCCGKQMDEVLVNDKRVMAICSVCGKTWRPAIYQLKYGNFTLSYRVKLLDSDDIDEKTEEARQKVAVLKSTIAESLKTEIDELWKKSFYSEGGFEEGKPIWKDTQEG
jgi:hypothetical protein